MLKEQQIGRIANEVLAKALGKSGFDRAAVEAKPDHNDEDALYVTVIFKSGAPVTSGAASAAAMEALNDALSDEGEPRFPYLVYEYPDDERPYELTLDESAP